MINEEKLILQKFELCYAFIATANDAINKCYILQQG